MRQHQWVILIFIFKLINYIENAHAAKQYDYTARYIIEKVEKKKHSYFPVAKVKYNLEKLVICWPNTVSEKSLSTLCHVICRQEGYATFTKCKRQFAANAKLGMNSNLNCGGNEQRVRHCPTTDQITNVKKCHHYLTVGCDTCYHHNHLGNGNTKVIRSSAIPTLYCEWLFTKDTKYFVVQVSKFRLSGRDGTCSENFLEFWSIDNGSNERLIERCCSQHCSDIKTDDTLMIKYFSGYKLTNYSGFEMEITAVNQRNRSTIKRSTSFKLAAIIIFVIVGFVTCFGCFCWLCKRQNNQTRPLHRNYKLPVFNNTSHHSINRYHYKYNNKKSIADDLNDSNENHFYEEIGSTLSNNVYTDPRDLHRKTLSVISPKDIRISLASNQTSSNSDPTVCQQSTLDRINIQSPISLFSNDSVFIQESEYENVSDRFKYENVRDGFNQNHQARKTFTLKPSTNFNVTLAEENQATEENCIQKQSEENYNFDQAENIGNIIHEQNSCHQVENRGNIIHKDNRENSDDKRVIPSIPLFEAESDNLYTVLVKTPNE